MAKVVVGAEIVNQVQRFDALTGRANVLRSRELSLNCVAAGIRSELPHQRPGWFRIPFSLLVQGFWRVWTVAYRKCFDRKRTDGRTPSYNRFRKGNAAEKFAK